MKPWHQPSTLSLVRQRAQLFANVTGQTTCAYRFRGQIVFQIEGWPIDGQLLVTVKPEEVKE